MSMQAISQDCQIRRIHGAEAGGQTTITGAATVDARPFDSVCFVATLGAITSGGTATLKAYGRKEHNTGTWVELAAAAAFTSADGADDKQLVLEVRRPSPWSELQVRLERADQDIALESIIAVCAAPQNRPAGIGDDVMDRTIVLGGVEA